ncbi:MAG: hypothetical protein Q4G30_07515 [Actinomycetaceae bacterium]|nr:hypothetical protein [Actinomycetaceae bacterium]
MSWFSGSQNKGAIPAPHATSFPGWDSPSVHCEVDDPEGVDGSFEAMFHGYNVEDYNGAEYDTWAYLRREPKNRGDYCATSVWVDGYWVGRLRNDDAASYVVEMNGLERQSMNLVVPARVWAQRTKSRLVHRVTLTMPPVGGVGPVNKFPRKAFTVLPYGEEMPLSDVESHANILRPLISTGREVSIAVALDIERNGVISAKIDEKSLIGTLSPVQAEKVRPLVERAKAAKLIPVARGVISGSEVLLDAWLLVASSDEDPDWRPTKDGGK